MFIFAVRWCGPGNSSTAQHEFGLFEEIDKCCKQHDECDTSIKSNGVALRLFSQSAFTISSCECDYAFIRCLKSFNNKVANGIGIVYTESVRKCIGAFEPSVCAQLDARSGCIRYVPYSALFVTQPQLRFAQFIDIPNYASNNHEILRQYFLKP